MSLELKRRARRSGTGRMSTTGGRSGGSTEAEITTYSTAGNKLRSRRAAVSPQISRDGDGDGDDGSKILRNVELVITRQEVEQMALRRVRRIAYRFRQQKFSYFMKLSSSFRRYNGVKVLIAMGCVLIALGIVVLAFTSSAVFEIPYKEGQTSVNFEVPRDANGPFYIYAAIQDFRAHYRRWMESRPSYFEAGACGAYDTVDAALYVRPKESFPELDRLDRHDPLFPCGLTSITYFNDDFELQALPASDCTGDCKPRNLTISTAGISPTELYVLYTALPPSKLVNKTWMNPLLHTRFQGWQYSSFSKDFLVLIGQLSEYILYRGMYRLQLTKNVWPANHFGAKKAVRIMAMGAMGSSQMVVGCLCVGWGLFLVVVGLVFLWGVRRNIVFHSNSLVGVSPDELRQQWINHARSWMKATGRAMSEKK